MAKLGKRKLADVTEEGLFHNNALQQGSKVYSNELSAHGYFNDDGVLIDGRLITPRYITDGEYSDEGYLKRGAVVYNTGEVVAHGEFNGKHLEYGTIIRNSSILEHGCFDKNEKLSFGTLIGDDRTYVGNFKNGAFTGVIISHDAEKIKNVSTVIGGADGILEMGTVDKANNLIDGVKVQDNSVFIGEYTGTKDDELGLTDGVKFSPLANQVTVFKTNQATISFTMEYKHDKLLIKIPRNLSQNVVVFEDDVRADTEHDIVDNRNDEEIDLNS